MDNVLKHTICPVLFNLGTRGTGFPRVVPVRLGTAASPRMAARRISRSIRERPTRRPCPRWTAWIRGPQNRPVQPQLLRHL